MPMDYISSCSDVLSGYQDNPSEEDINEGMLIVFNLDSSITIDDLRQIFGIYGEIKEVMQIFCIHYIDIDCGNKLKFFWCYDKAANDVNPEFDLIDI